jgi:hypothetical protein
LKGGKLFAATVVRTAGSERRKVNAMPPAYEQLGSDWACHSARRP